MALRLADLDPSPRRLPPARIVALPQRLGAWRVPPPVYAPVVRRRPRRSMAVPVREPERRD